MSSWVEPDDAVLVSMTPAEREACWRVLDRERVLLEVRLARFGQRLGAHGFHHEDGHRSLRGYGRAACNWSTAEAARMERLGRLLDRFPCVADAVDAGLLGSPQLHLLARVAANPRVGEHVDAGIELLVSQAAVLDFDDLVIAAARWESMADEDGCGDRHERAHRNRHASLHVGEHGFVLDATGANTVGVQLREILDAYTRSEFLHDWDTGVAVHGEQMCPARLARTDAQRRADALHAIFLAAGGSAGVELTVNVVIGYDRFQRQLTTTLGGQPAPLDLTDLRQPCETIDGHQLDPRDVLAAAAAGYVRRVVVDSAGVVVEIGRRQRLFTGTLRDAVMLAAPRCVWPGCQLPAPRCQADHMIPHVDDGPTNTRNGAPLYGHHNRWKTHGYTTHRDNNGHWHHHRPDGTEIGWRTTTTHTHTDLGHGWHIEHITLEQLHAA
jgi:hypothetical protein